METFIKEDSALSGIFMNVLQGYLVVPVQTEMCERSAIRLQKQILERVKETGVKGVVIDVSGVTIIDTSVAHVISDTAKMASLLGASTVLTGLRPGVVGALMDLEFEFEGLDTALTVEQGILKLKSLGSSIEKLDVYIC
ncbi:MAG: STAS domain-containing protein [Deltaproteobacteria bacterium]|nr:STAS domain-containing protein [Deltaproteobacteria bacterium]